MFAHLQRTNQTKIKDGNSAPGEADHLRTCTANVPAQSQLKRSDLNIRKLRVYLAEWLDLRYLGSWHLVAGLAERLANSAR